MWAHLFCSRHKLEKMPRDRKRKIEIDPGKMTDKEREEEKIQDNRRGGKRMRVMVTAVCVSALTML